MGCSCPKRRRPPLTPARYSRLWGKMGEGHAEREFDLGGIMPFIEAGNFGCPVPVLGTPYFAYRDALIPYIAGATGFASLSDLISEMTGGKRQDLRFVKVGTAGVVASSNSLWNVGTTPPAGGVAAAAPGGAVPTKATTGAMPFTNPSGSDTLHLIGSDDLVATVGPNALLLYDRLFHGTQSLNATNTAWTGVPNRYTGAASVGNFVSLELTTLMNATATNLTVTYVDQDGNAAEATVAHALTVSSAVNRIPLASPLFACLLNGSDTGLRNFTNIQSSGANTGVANFFVGHPLAVLPLPLANHPSPQDRVNSLVGLPEIKSNACLALIEYQRAATTATSYQGSFVVCSG